MPTPQQEFERELRARLVERGATILATDQAVVAELLAARDQVLQILAGQPTDFERWQLTKLLDQVNAVLEGATGNATSILHAGLRTAWQQGEDLVDKPLAAAGLNVEMQLPLLNTQTLQQLQTFTALRLKDVGMEATRKIGSQLSMVTLGVRSPFEAIASVQKILGNDSPQRATTIVRTEVARSFASASFQRLQQTAQLVPGMQKKWRRSGKIHSRWNHDAADGQVVDVDKPFVLPSDNGPVKLMYPHDPQAPIEEVINCGCVCLPHRSSWKMTNPGALPFSEQEKRLDHRKGLLDQAAKRAGMRTALHPNALPGSDKAVIPMAKLAGYSLNPDHPVGGNKARVLVAALGFTQENAAELKKAIKARVGQYPAQLKSKDQYGQRYAVDIPMTGPAGTGIVRTGWIVDEPGAAPRLTTVYMQPPKKPKPKA